MNKKIVVLGGGTGLSALLSGIKNIKNIDLTAIVTVADSGGSTGILRNHFQIPAVGDLRQVLTSLSNRREELEKSMAFRISGTNTDLDGHSVGNIILASQILMEKDFAKGIKAASRMLNIVGTVLPVSNQHDHLLAELEDGSILKEEDKIGHSKQKIKRIFYHNSQASLEAIEVLKKADYIILGIGSLYTSLIANLAYPQVKKAIMDSKAKIWYFANVFTQHGETDDMSLNDHITAIEKHTYKNIIDKIIVSNTKIPQKIIASYAADKQYLLKIDRKDIIFFDLIKIIKNEDMNRAVKHDRNKIEICLKKLLKIG